jgi:hypothetical protein
MQRSQIAGVAAAVLFLSACGSGAEALPTPTLFVLPTPLPTDLPSAQPESQTLPTQVVAEAVEAPPSELPTPTLVPGRPTAPAVVGESFRPDLAIHVAATGKPQLLEFFTYW